MNKILLSAAAVLVAGPALAQSILPTPSAEEGRAPRPPRARGISTALAVEAAQTAIATCTAQGLKVTALVIDSEGVPIAMDHVMRAACREYTKVDRLIMDGEFGRYAKAGAQP